MGGSEKASSRWWLLDWSLREVRCPALTKRDEEHLERVEKELDPPKLRRQGSGKEDRSEAVHRVNARGPVARVGGTMGNRMRLHFHVNLLTSHKECAMQTLTRSHSLRRWKTHQSGRSFFLHGKGLRTDSISVKGLYPDGS